MLNPSIFGKVDYFAIFGDVFGDVPVSSCGGGLYDRNVRKYALKNEYVHEQRAGHVFP